MMLIIEGPDNSGKSTLAAWLQRRLGWPMDHSGGPVKDTTARDARLQRFFTTQRPVIFDRFPCISERVYGPHLRNYDVFYDEDGRSWLSQFHHEPRLVIYCRAPLDIMLDLKDHVAKLEHEDQAHVDQVRANALRLIHRYDELMVTEDHLDYDYTAGGHQFRKLLVHHLLTRS